MYQIGIFQMSGEQESDSDEEESESTHVDIEADTPTDEPKPRKSQSMKNKKRKSEKVCPEDKMLGEILTTMKEATSTTPQDQDGLFADFVAGELRQLKDPKLKARVRHTITGVLVDAQSQCGSMPQPQMYEYGYPQGGNIGRPAGYGYMYSREYYPSVQSGPSASFQSGPSASFQPGPSASVQPDDGPSVDKE